MVPQPFGPERSSLSVSADACVSGYRSGALCVFGTYFSDGFKLHLHE